MGKTKRNKYPCASKIKKRPSHFGFLRKNTPPEKRDQLGNTEGNTQVAISDVPGRSSEDQRTSITAIGGPVSDVYGCRSEDKSTFITEVGAASNSDGEHVIQGRRIVDLDYFIRELRLISEQCGRKYGCGFTNLQVVGEKRFGLTSKITFVCKMCNVRSVISTNDNKDSDRLEVNRSAVSGIMAVGGGFSQLEEYLAAIDVPAMSQKTYGLLHDELSLKWEDTAIDIMAEAAAKERDAALEEGRVDVNGTPMIDVVADGCWGKRSYRNNYSSLSGAAAIIGKKFGEVLFMAVRNKYCCICSYAERKKTTCPDHICFKNYSGSSSSMEADIILEGFKRSVSMYNVIYARLISDGDSSTYSKILTARPYPNHSVEKVECRNHVLRNYCNKLRLLTTDTKYPINSRKLITVKRVLALRTAIKTSIKYNKSQPVSLTTQIHNLYTDVSNAPSHVFGDHAKCKPYFCSGPKLDEKNLVPELRGSSIWLRLLIINSTVASHSRSLIHDIDSNVVERFNCIVAKFIGGKRINYSLKQSYQARCHAAVVSFNTRRALCTLQKNILGKSPSSHIKKLEMKRLRKTRLNLKYSRRKNRSISAKKNDPDHGEHSAQPDMPPVEFEKNKAAFLQNLEHNRLRRDFIQNETILQAESGEWLELRRSMITASNFGKIVTRKDHVKCANLVKTLLGNKNISSVSGISHGKKYEKVALRELSTQENVCIEPCGLFVDERLAFLGATPDGIAGDMVVEVKCPLTAFKLGLDDAIKRKKVNFWKENGSINTSHYWYHQIQGQLHITGKKKCIFGLWSGSHVPIKVEYIHRDDIFWNTNMEAKLVRFYMECLLPEIIDSRLDRNMPIREPEYILKALELKSKPKSTKRRLSYADASIHDTDEIASTSGTGSTLLATPVNVTDVASEKILDFDQF